MHSSEKDYKTIYRLQDRVLDILSNVLGDFYLTGGTALGRYYLDHRYSDDLDFFVNSDPEFDRKSRSVYEKLKTGFNINESLLLITENYLRIWINDDVPLKIDIVNDVESYWGKPYWNGRHYLDNPANILANKMGTILNREEPKDVYDIICIAIKYAFNWREAFEQAKAKQLFDETDFVMMFSSFPVQVLKSQEWLQDELNVSEIQAKIEIITNDFIAGTDNSLGMDKPDLLTACPMSVVRCP